MIINLINRILGDYLFLAEIFTDLLRCKYVLIVSFAIKFDFSLEY